MTFVKPNLSPDIALKRIINTLALCLMLCAAGANAQEVVQIPERLTMGDLELIIEEGARGPLKGYVSKLTGNPKYFRQMVDRADAYLPIVERIFQEEGLPDDFKYLVIQESSLVSNQVSSSNAVGYWQFKKETATEMGLRVDGEVDERMNIVSSSRSAARYLLRHNNYMQNWAYALLSYYAGLGGAKNLIDPTKIGSKTLEINENTHWYILRFIAHKIAFEPHLYRNTAAPNLRICEYGDCENKSLEQLASETNYPLDQIQFYNRWILGNYVPGDKDYTLILPLKAEDGTVFNSPVYVKAAPPVEKLEPWRDKMFFGLIEKPVTQPEPVVLANGQTEIPVFFDWNGIKAIQAKKGDNSARLALLAGISREEFLEYNDLRIFDPLVEGEVYYASNKKRKAKIPFHTVQHGESLWEVAQKYGIRINALMAKNRMPRPEKLKPGRVLWLRHRRPEDEPIRYEPVPEPPKQEFLAKKTMPARPEPAAPPIVAPAPSASAEPTTAAAETVLVNTGEALKQAEQRAKTVLGTDTLNPELPETASETAAGAEVEIEIVPEPAKASVAPEPAPVALASNGNQATAEAVRKTPPAMPVVTQPEPATIPAKPLPLPQNGEIEVQAGMTWYQVSRAYKASLDSLFSWNTGSSRDLKAGQKIRVETPRPASLPQAEVRPVMPQKEASAPGQEWYEVKAGDSAYSIARKYGMKVDRFLEINGKEDAALRIGDRMKVESGK
jgi:membrane-bound lytic murein transglycosylase D